MRWLLFGCFLLLCSCSGVSSVNNIADSAEKTIVALEKTLPDNCYTDNIKALTESIKTQIKGIVNACDVEKEVLSENLMKWKIAFVSLLFVFLYLILGKKFL